MDESLRAATDEFVNQRVSYYGKNETEAVNGAYMELRACADRLREALNEEQERLLRFCENAYHVADGETRQFYYKAGFDDAIRFLMNWKE